MVYLGPLVLEAAAVVLAALLDREQTPLVPLLVQGGLADLVGLVVKVELVDEEDLVATGVAVQ